MEKINKNELKKICIELNEICKNSDYEYKDSKEHLIRASSKRAIIPLKC